MAVTAERTSSRSDRGGAAGGRRQPRRHPLRVRRTHTGSFAIARERTTPFSVDIGLAGLLGSGPRCREQRFLATLRGGIVYV